MASQRELAEQLFEVALELNPMERATFLGRACGGDPELRRMVEALLTDDAAAGSFLQHPIQQRSSTNSLDISETVIGPYHLLEPIGEGGMGEVWLAEQRQPVRRRVAIKLIKVGMDTREVVARFEVERQALALMDHPAIAKVFEAGSTPQGRPYFVMEYVAGVPITAYCDRHKLTVRQRMELFIHVCEGVQHAHQKAIIHRDLKPSNILVTEVDGKPMPRIIDFGVAKATSQKLSAGTVYTRLGTLIGTLGYMSPEQADPIGEDIDTRTDVYSLGAVLYELLSGALPLDFTKGAYDEVLHRLRDEDATRPSTKLTTLGEESAIAAKNRSVDAPTLVRQLRGDPDSIALKALEKDRASRYASAAELGADIGRYLRNEPVTAHPPSVAYRTRKYLRRHRLGLPQTHRLLLVALSALLAVSLASVAYLLFRHRAGAKSAGWQDQKVLRTVPITSAAGDAISPVFSPDGRELAFVWDGSDRKGYDVYVQLIAAAIPLQLTHRHLGLIGPPAWSPDGAQIAFERCDGKHDGIYAVAALGSDERQITTAACYYTLPNPVAWMADGKDILMVDHCAPGGRFGIVDLSLATGEKRCLTNISGDKNDDIGWGFALSPDASTIAFGRTTASLCCDVYKAPVTGGKTEQITADGHTGCSTLSENGCSGLMWTPDGRSIIYVNTRSSLPELFRVEANGKAGEPDTTYPAIGNFTRDGTRFAYSQHTSSDPPAVWRAKLAGPGGTLLRKTRIIASQFPETDAQPSPDGTRLVWMSMRTGSEEIFVSDSGGHGQTQLTHLNRYSGSPRWSPDSKWIAFDSYDPREHVQIWIVDPQGRNLQKVISPDFDCAVPNWSRDGKAIYFSGKRDGLWQVWRHDFDTGVDVQLTNQGGFDPTESRDGRTVYYSRFYEAGIWKIPSSGGPETLVVSNRPQVGFWGHYAVSATGLYFLDNDAEPHPTIDFYSFAMQRIVPVFTVDEHPARLQPSLSVTADGRSIYFTQYDRQSVIKMMEFER